VVELPQDWAEDKPLKTVDVSSPLLTGARLRLHCFIFLLVEHRYSNLTIYVTTEACESLAGELEENRKPSGQRRGCFQRPQVSCLFV